MKRFIGLAAALVVIMWYVIPAGGAGPEGRSISEGKRDVSAGSTTPQKRDDYQKAAEAELRELGAQIDGLAREASRLGGARQREAGKEIDALRKSHAAAVGRLGELKTASGRAWDEGRDGLDSAIAEMKMRCEKVTSRFK